MTGGHFKSGRSFGRGLICAGHHVSVFVPCKRENRHRLSMYSDIGAHICKLPGKVAASGTKSRIGGLFAEIYVFLRMLQVVLVAKIDVLHCQDDVYIRQACWVGWITRRKVVCTHPGGKYRDMCLPKFVPLIVYSLELLEAYSNAPFYTNHVGIHYIRGRIDTDCFCPGKPNLGFLEQYSLRPDCFLAFMAIRIDRQKMTWLDSFFSLAEELAHSGRIAELVVAGDGKLFEVLRSRAEHFNSLHNSVRIHFIGALLDDAVLAGMMRCASVVLGNGRGTMEAMACGRPVVVLGESSNGDRLRDENVNDIAYWNFSGRHLRFVENPVPFSKLVVDLFDNLEKYREDAKHLQLYAHGELGYMKGAAELEQIYEKTSRYRLSGLLNWECDRHKFRSILRNDR